MTPHEYDGAQPERFDAYQAEKQLILSLYTGIAEGLYFDIAAALYPGWKVPEDHGNGEAATQPAPARMWILVLRLYGLGQVRQVSAPKIVGLRVARKVRQRRPASRI
jgi:hypothetical protein